MTRNEPTPVSKQDFTEVYYLDDPDVADLCGDGYTSPGYYWVTADDGQLVGPYFRKDEAIERAEKYVP